MKHRKIVVHSAKPLPIWKVAAVLAREFGCDGIIVGTGVNGVPVGEIVLEGHDGKGT